MLVKKVRGKGRKRIETRKANREAKRRESRCN
jgi:hypothetical protein